MALAVKYTLVTVSVIICVVDSQEFTLKTQLDLESALSSAQTRAISAEEQLQSLQRYIAQSMLAYQKEIMRLRSLLQQQPQQQQQQQQQGMRNANPLIGSPDVRSLLQRSPSAGSRKGNAAGLIAPLNRPTKSASDGQGKLPLPLNLNPAVDAWQ